MDNFFLIYLLSTVVGIIGTYYFIKMAVKHGVEAANKPKVVDPVEKEKNDEANGWLIIGGFIVVIVFGLMTGMFN